MSARRRRYRNCTFRTSPRFMILIDVRLSFISTRLHEPVAYFLKHAKVTGNRPFSMVLQGSFVTRLLPGDQGIGRQLSQESCM
jgi:hypothetical protein